MPTGRTMNRTAGPIRAGARKRRSSRRSPQRRRRDWPRATASNARRCYKKAVQFRRDGRTRTLVAEIKLEQLTKVYPDGTRAVDGLDLEIGDGELVVLVGPSGCGKTSALRMVAGLEEITEGRVWLGERMVNRVPPKDRDIAMIFQNYALYPHMSAYANMAFALKMQKLPKREIETRVGRAARVLGLIGVLKKRPRTLSGGQRQRVAVMRGGVLQQFDKPSVLYERPVNLFVAEFIGSPAMNLVGADLRRSNGSLEVVFGDHRLRLDDSLRSARPALERFEGRRLILGIRPEDIEDAALGSSGVADERRLRAVVDICEDMGSEILAHFGVGAAPVRGADVTAAVGEEAMAATAEHAKEKGSLFVARLDRATGAREREELDLVVRTDRLHFFDPETGLGIYVDPPAGEASAAEG